MAQVMAADRDGGAEARDCLGTVFQGEGMVVKVLREQKEPGGRSLGEGWWQEAGS